MEIEFLSRLRDEMKFQNPATQGPDSGGRRRALKFFRLLKEYPQRSRVRRPGHGVIGSLNHWVIEPSDHSALDFYSGQTCLDIG